MIVLNGSARVNGNTSKVADFVSKENGAQVINLVDHEILDFSYDGPGEDDFVLIVEKMIAARSVIWLTPIYWYTMSTQMKRFLDRITDLLKWNKDLGRQLRGLEMYVLSSSEDDDAPDEFPSVFKLSAGYLGMTYKGYQHTWLEEDRLSEESIARIKRMLPSS